MDYPFPVAEIGERFDIVGTNEVWIDVFGEIAHLSELNAVLPEEGQTSTLEECLSGRSLRKMQIKVKDKEGQTRPALLISRREKIGYTVFIIGLDDVENCTLNAVAVPWDSHFGHFRDLVGKSEPMQEVYRLITLAADSVANVLISGESGTGKELVARAIHDVSARRDRPFIAVNCSALSEQLLESELFGHVKGAFTGADRDKEGRFEAAHGGTIFLDEIGEISPLIQVKLLRVLQEKVIERVGSNQSRKVDMRIIGATNRNLRSMVQDGTFREDLFFRLNVFSIRTIPLREIETDVPLLCGHFLDLFRKETGKNIRGFSDDVMRLFLEYCWPGNVRELRNTIEHAFVVSSGGLIDVFDLPQELRISGFRQGVCQGKLAGGTLFHHSAAEPSSDSSYFARIKPRNTISKDQLAAVLAESNGNKSEAARRLGISRVALYNKIKSFGIES